MKPIYIALPLFCSLPALNACVSSQPKQEIWGMTPIYNVQHGGGNARDYYQLGRYFQGQNRLDQAADAYKKALTMDSNHLEAHNALGAIYSMLGKFDQAIVQFNNVIERAPQAAHLFNNLGYTYFLQNKFPEAIETFEKALALDPYHERSLNNLAQAYTQNGNPEKANEVLARVETIKGKSPVAPIIAAAPTVPATPSALATPVIASTPSAPVTPPEPAKPIVVAATPVTARNLEKISAGGQTPALALVPEMAKRELPATASKTETAQPASIAAVQEKTEPAISTAAALASGYSVITELKPLSPEPKLLALAIANNPVTKPAKLEVIPAQIKSGTNQAPIENKSAFDKITQAALQELAPNSVKLKAAKDLVAGIFRGVETAFSDLINGKPFRLEIANGNGVSGLAKKVNEVLASNGVPAARITNHKNYQQPHTVVQYRSGYQAQATALSKGLRNKPQLQETANLRANTDVRLVLGRDVATQTALFEVESQGIQLASNSHQTSSIE